MIVKSVSCPTAEITGTFDATTARASPSSLNAARSSADPPPRATIITSTSTLAAIEILARQPPPPPPPSPPAPAPDKSPPAPTDAACGRCSKYRAAPPPAEKSPSRSAPATAASLSLRPASNNPSASSFAFSCSNATCSAPAPFGSMYSAEICNSPRSSYTVTRPRSTTCIPSAGRNLNSRACDRNITTRICAFPSFSVKYKMPRIGRAKIRNLALHPRIGILALDGPAHRRDQLPHFPDPPLRRTKAKPELIEIFHRYRSESQSTRKSEEFFAFGWRSALALRFACDVSAALAAAVRLPAASTAATSVPATPPPTAPRSAKSTSPAENRNSYSSLDN